MVPYDPPIIYRGFPGGFALGGGGDPAGGTGGLCGLGPDFVGCFSLWGEGGLLIKVLQVELRSVIVLGEGLITSYEHSMTRLRN